MKFRSKLLSVILAGVLASCSFSYADHVENQVVFFKDISADYWAKDSIEKIIKMGIASGYPDGTFRPSSSVTRAEFVTMVNTLMGYKEMKAQTSFKDLKETAWYYPAILVAEKEGYIAGFSDGTFRPGDKITKEQVCVILSRIMNLQELSQDVIPNDKVSDWARPYVITILSNRIVSLDQKGNFYAKDFATRAFVADAIAKFAISNESVESIADKKLQENQGGSPASNGISTGGVSAGATSGGGGASASIENPQTQIPPEIPKKETEEEKTVRLTQEVAQVLKDNISFFDTEAEREVVRDIVSNMEEYIQNQNYDYKSAAKEVQKKYNKLSLEEKEDLKYKIQLYVSSNSLFELKDKFFQ